MSRMTVRSFPRTRDKPQKRILLVPFLLMFGGWAMTFIYILQFWGTIIAMSGALTAFLVGAVYADLWASQRRSQKYYAERQKEFLDTPTDDSEREIIEDPFEETYDDEESQSGNTE